MQFISNYFQTIAIFINSEDCIGNISSKSIRNSPNLFEKLSFEPLKMNFALSLRRDCLIPPHFTDIFIGILGFLLRFNFFFFRIRIFY